ncbi:MAG: Gfo/Idh/MocA family oxidoreductase [Armatimonadia bacterium]
MIPLDHLRFGVVGAAQRGASFFSAITTNPRARLQALCDLDEPGLQKTAAEAGVSRTYTEYERLLDEGEIDAVVIGTPMPLHASQAMMALERGIHVLSEVPACVSMQEAQGLVAACKRSRATYMMAENYCYMRPNTLVKAIARAGLFGQMYFAEGEYLHELKELNEVTKWRRRWQTGVNGCTYPTHSLGPVLQWLDERVVSVLCTGTGHHYRDPRGDEYENEDSTTMLCRTSGGGLVQIRLDMLSNRPHNMTYYSLQGTTGCYEAARGLGDQPKIWLADRCEKLEWMPLEDLAEEFLPEEWLRPSEAQLQAGHGGGDYLEVQDFISAVLDGVPPPVGIHEALDMTMPGLMSQQSIAQGGTWVEVPDSRAW